MVAATIPERQYPIADIGADAKVRHVTKAGASRDRTGDRIRIDLKAGTANILISDEELAQRRAALEKAGGFKYPPSQTPWQEIQRGMVDQLADGMVLRPAVKYQRVAQESVPRDNH
jgi:dihydroxy-acid dehydratase